MSDGNLILLFIFATKKEIYDQEAFSVFPVWNDIVVLRVHCCCAGIRSLSGVVYDNRQSEHKSNRQPHGT
jgi:hypothetical protein